jgi:hypothetical protein
MAMPQDMLDSLNRTQGAVTLAGMAAWCGERLVSDEVRNWWADFTRSPEYATQKAAEEAATQAAADAQHAKDVQAAKDLLAAEGFAVSTPV